MADSAANLRLGYCFCGPESVQNPKYNGERPSHQFADERWDSLALRMTKRAYHQKTPSVQEFEDFLFQTVVLVREVHGTRRQLGVVTPTYTCGECSCVLENDDCLWLTAEGHGKQGGW